MPNPTLYVILSFSRIRRSRRLTAIAFKLPIRSPARLRSLTIATPACRRISTGTGHHCHYHYHFHSLTHSLSECTSRSPGHDGLCNPFHRDPHIYLRVAQPLFYPLPLAHVSIAPSLGVMATMFLLQTMTKSSTPYPVSKVDGPNMDAQQLCSIGKYEPVERENRPGVDCRILNDHTCDVARSLDPLRRG